MKVDWNKPRDQHCQWLQKVGWDNGSVVEKLVLVSSEIGESANECRGDEPSRDFQYELADIVLRVLGIAGSEKANLNRCIDGLEHYRVSEITSGFTALEEHAQIIVLTAVAINHHLAGLDIDIELAKVILHVIDVADKYGIDLQLAIRQKMATNELNGTRGRKK